MMHRYMVAAKQVSVPPLASWDGQSGSWSATADVQITTQNHGLDRYVAVSVAALGCAYSSGASCDISRPPRRRGVALRHG